MPGTTYVGDGTLTTMQDGWIRTFMCWITPAMHRPIYYAMVLHRPIYYACVGSPIQRQHASSFWPSSCYRVGNLDLLNFFSPLLQVEDPRSATWQLSAPPGLLGRTVLAWVEALTVSFALALALGFWFLLPFLLFLFGPLCVKRCFFHFCQGTHCAVASAASPCVLLGAEPRSKFSVVL